MTLKFTHFLTLLKYFFSVLIFPISKHEVISHLPPPVIRLGVDFDIIYCYYHYVVGRSIESIEGLHFGIVSYVSLGNMGVGQGGQMVISGGLRWSKCIASMGLGCPGCPEVVWRVLR